VKPNSRVRVPTFMKTNRKDQAIRLSEMSPIQLGDAWLAAYEMSEPQSPTIEMIETMASLHGEIDAIDGTDRRLATDCHMPVGEILPNDVVFFGGDTGRLSSAVVRSVSGESDRVHLNVDTLVAVDLEFPAQAELRIRRER
jgi:hypothetical protein